MKKSKCRLMSKAVKTSRTKILAFLFVMVYDKRYREQKKKGRIFMLNIRKLYGVAKIDKLELGQNNQEIDIKYYRIKKLIRKGNKKYGIEIIKEQKQGKVMTREKSRVNCISNNKEIIENLLKILIKNRVTPTATNDVITDLRKNPQIIYDML